MKKAKETHFCIIFLNYWYNNKALTALNKHDLKLEIKKIF